jgi:dynactin-5
MIKDCAKIADNTVLMPNAVIPAQTHYAGSPGQLSLVLAVITR